MSQGLIICGYPGIGKTSIGGWNNCIDLESSNFKTTSLDTWEDGYARVAMDIASQGFTVLVSTHPEVIDRLKRPQSWYEDNFKPIIFCPRKSMKDAWINRLRDRYLADPSPKNRRAYDHVVLYFESDIKALENSGLLCFHPEDMNYNLKDFIITIRTQYGIRS